MRILHVNDNDLPGRRFNGHDMQIELNKRGITAHQAVMERRGADPHTMLIPGAKDPVTRSKIMRLEEELSLHAMLYPFLFHLMDLPEFKQASIVHYHLLHNYFGSLPIFPEITSIKPSVVTIHDPWLFTGHCIHPFSCTKWKTGCGECEHLDAVYRMKKDKTALQWQMKKNMFSKAHLDLVVSSEYMERLVQESPITSQVENIHRIPFGIDLNVFYDNGKRDEIRRKLDIPEENFVLLFRADENPFKGFSCIRNMLDEIETAKPITLIAVGTPGPELLNKYREKYHVIDFEWITESRVLAELYCACNLFLMPSTAEAFGMMAIEAMASSRPVLSCEGTAVPDVTFAPKCGIVIPQNDSKAMADTVCRLIAHPEEAEARGRLGRELAEKYYSFDDYVSRHLKLYEEILSRSLRQ